MKRSIILRRPFLAAILLHGFFCFLFPFPSLAVTPTEQLRATVEEVMAILTNSSPKSEADAQEFRTKLIQAISPRFDFNEMAKRSLGPHWQRRTPEEQREFVTVLAAFLGRSYVRNIRSSGKPQIVYTRELRDTTFAEVDTKIMTEKPQALLVNYKLHLVDGDWKVYDVVVDNVSLINNYRSQFDRVITQSSFENLLHVMKEKNPQAPDKQP